MSSVMFQETDVHHEDLNTCFQKIPNPFQISEDLVPEEDHYFTAPFTRDKQDMYV